MWGSKTLRKPVRLIRKVQGANPKVAAGTALERQHVYMYCGKYEVSWAMYIHRQLGGTT